MRASPAAWRAWVEHGSQEDWSTRVGVLDLPTLIVAGAQDASLGVAIQRRLTLPHFRNATLTVIEGGHALPLENPQALAAAIEQFNGSLANR
jgi:pimeloyl-ACP methyl ester carboxylesterase